MGSYDLLQENPGAFLGVLLISLVLTVVVYGAFPVLFAKTRSAPITKKKYFWLCYGINFVGFVVFTILDGVGTAAPYFLWTYVFSKYGKKTLEANGLLLDGLSKDKERPKSESAPTSCIQQNNITAQSKSVAKQNRTEHIVAQKSPEAFCRKCGNKLLDDAAFCHKCGSKRIWNEKEL